MRRSWLEWITDLVDAAPAPRWLVYAAGLVIWTLLTAVIGWSAAIRPFPEVVLSPVFAGVFPAILLWSKQALDRVAERSLATLSPALDLEAGQIDSLAGELRRTPPGWAALAVPLGVAAGVIDVSLRRTQPWRSQLPRCTDGSAQANSTRRASSTTRSGRPTRQCSRSPGCRPGHGARRPFADSSAPYSCR